MPKNSTIRSLYKKAWSFALLGPRWAWLQSREWAWFGGLVLGGFGVASVNEFGLAVLFFVLASISASSQLWKWSGDGVRASSRTLLQLAGTLGILTGLLALIGIVNVYRDNRPWSQLPKAYADAKNWLSPINKPPDARDHPPTLADLFRTDFPYTMKFTDPHCSIQWTNGDVSTAQCQAYMDFEGKSEFFGYYIPSSPRSFELARQAAKSTRMNILQVQKQISLSGGIGEQMTDLKDLVFSGRVYLYYEGPLTITEEASLIEAFKQQNLDVQFRANSYLVLQDNAWYYKHNTAPKQQ